MKITVLIGSPKEGTKSVTLHYVLFLKKKFPQHEFTIFHVARDVRKLEADEQAFGEVLESVKAADAVLWAFSVYATLVHAYYKRFIELIFERAAGDAFRDKYTAILTTSIKFFDHTALNYVNAICDDLGMKYLGSHAPEMYDLLEEEGRKQMVRFGEKFFAALEAGIATSKTFAPVKFSDFEYVPGDAQQTVELGGKKVVVLSDAREDQTNLKGMVQRFQKCFAQPIQVLNLHEVEICSGCRGCFMCGPDNECVFRDADGIFDLFRNTFAPADVLVFAGSVRDRYLSSRWKHVFDRGFFNNQVPVFQGKQLGYIVSGPLGQMANLRQALEGYGALQGASMAGFVSDECADSRQIDRLLEGFAHQLLQRARSGYLQPPTFLGVGTRKVFRDVVKRAYFVFQKTHRYYKKHGYYRTPKNHVADGVTAAIAWVLTKFPAFRRSFRADIPAKTVEKFEKLIKRL